MKKKAIVLSTGLAMFSMFFGSGNLVFPLVVGKLSEGHFGWGAFGILLTGVLVPFLGILAMLLFEGKTDRFFERLGKPAVFLAPLIALSLMGPFGVLARCITVAHGAFKLLLPNTALWTFSILSCACIFFMTIKKRRIVPILGSILTPILLLSLICIAFFGLSSESLPDTSFTRGEWNSLKNGIFQGYQTMDLLAAFFFSSFVIKYLKSNPEIEKKGKTLSTFLQSAFLGAFLLSSVYFILVLLGSMYAPQLSDIPPQEMLAFIAQKALGPMAAPIVCSAIVLACLTTAIVLTSLFADFLRKEISKEKLPPSLCIAITLLIAFATSSLEFSGIAKFLGPILEVIYPALILLTILSIFHKLWGWSSVRFPIVVAFLLKLAAPLVTLR